MMLSEAIRLGAMLREQCVKTLFDGEKSSWRSPEPACRWNSRRKWR